MPPPDEADLTTKCRARGRHEEPDTFVLYRIVGADLPSRHVAGPSIADLRFIPRNEPEPPGCGKRWVPKRLRDPGAGAEIAAMREEAGRPVLRIAFDGDEYARGPWMVEVFPEPGMFHAPVLAALGPEQRARRRRELPSRESGRDEQQRRAQRGPGEAGAGGPSGSCPGMGTAS